MSDVRYHAQCQCGWQGLFEETAEAANAQALEHDGTAHTLVVQEIQFDHEAGEDGRCIWCGELIDGSPCPECNGERAIRNEWTGEVDRCPSCTQIAGSEGGGS